MNPLAKYWIRTALWMTAFGAVLKVLLGIKLIDFSLVISGWMLFGGIITFDDELAGRSYNPDGERPYPIHELAGIGLSFVAFCGLKIWMTGA